MMSSDSHLSDSDELLSTKLAPPHLHAPLVTRQPLLGRLDEGLEHQLTLISAPAGFGKTTTGAAIPIDGGETAGVAAQREEG